LIRDYTGGDTNSASSRFEPNEPRFAEIVLVILLVLVFWIFKEEDENEEEDDPVASWVRGIGFIRVGCRVSCRFC